MAIGLVASAGLLLASVVPAFGATGGLPFTVELTGAAEVTGGDPDGSGTATVTVNPGTGEVCWTIRHALKSRYASCAPGQTLGVTPAMQEEPSQ
jgi:hypothetical protein